MNTRRIFGLVLRYLYLYRRSLPRLIEIFYWPTLELVLWGFITLFLSNSEMFGNSTFVTNVLQFLIGAIILWEVFLRSSLGVSIGFLEELWSKNLFNLFVTPLNEHEFLAGILATGFIKIFASFIVTSIIAWLLYTFNIFSLGPSLLPFVLNLLFSGWVFGIFATAVILRYGVGAEVLAWGIAFAIQPFAAVFYPVSVFPQWLQSIAGFLPLSHVFEGMRSVITTGQIPVTELAWAFGLNFGYLFAAVSFFMYMFRIARQRGYLLRTE